MSRVSMREVLNRRRHGDPHWVANEDGSKRLINPMRRLMKAKGVHGKGKKRFRKALRKRASANNALPTDSLEGLVGKEMRR